MPSVQWNPKYATGIPAIDEQHKSLINAIHALQVAIEEGRAQAETLELMEFLERYVDEHFALEEAYMEHISFPELPAHREVHDRLRIRVQALHSRLSRGDAGVTMELPMLLFEWLRDHILHDDFSYVHHARERRRQQA
jgi:hemerythrin-like metal-binding protein